MLPLPLIIRSVVAFLLLLVLLMGWIAFHQTGSAARQLNSLLQYYRPTLEAIQEAERNLRQSHILLQENLHAPPIPEHDLQQQLVQLQQQAELSNTELSARPEVPRIDLFAIRRLIYFSDQSWQAHQQDPNSETYFDHYQQVQACFVALFHNIKLIIGQLNEVDGQPPQVARLERIQRLLLTLQTIQEQRLERPPLFRTEVLAHLKNVQTQLAQAGQQSQAWGLNTQLSRLEPISAALLQQVLFIYQELADSDLQSDAMHQMQNQLALLQEKLYLGLETARQPLMERLSQLEHQLQQQASLRAHWFYVVILLATVAAAAGSLMLSALLRWRTQPILKAAQSLAQGHFHHHIQMPSSDFLQQVADAFNQMARTLAQKDRGLRYHAEMLERDKQQLEQTINERTRELKQNVEALKREISHHQQTAQQLQLASKVVENTQEAIVIADLDYRIIDTNPAFSLISGYSRQQALDQDLFFHCPEYRHRHDNTVLPSALIRDGKWHGEISLERKQGNRYPALLSLNLISDDSGNPACYVGVFSDISHLKAAQQKLSELAFYDPLSHLPNRTLFRERLQQQLKNDCRHRRHTGLLFIDLDQFKAVNDTYGHDKGDELLKIVAERLNGCLRRPHDSVARLGGDEFTLILGDLATTTDCEPIAEQLLQQLRAPIQIADLSLHIGASIGIAVAPEDGATAETLLKNADTAMYQAKAQGRNSYCFFRPQMTEVTRKNLEIRNDLHVALKQGQFELYYQPKVDLHSGRADSYEALLRWHHPRLGLLSPDRFMAMAEETSLILQIGEWVLTEACQQLVAWQHAHPHPLGIAVNLSVRQLQDPCLLEILNRTLAQTGIMPTQLELEVTETMAMANLEEAQRTLMAIRQLGIKIAMDDFGTGFASLSYLRQLPIDTLKVDRCFIRDLADNPDDQAIIAAIATLSNALGLALVAEGVESAEQRDLLAHFGFRQFQGYLFSRPCPATKVPALLARQWRPQTLPHASHNSIPTETASRHHSVNQAVAGG